jgi:hypothetical protein
MPPIRPERPRQSRRTIHASACGLALVLACTAAAASARAQVASLKGDAALKHPAVQAALKAAELLKGGKVDEAMALRTKEFVSEWKAMPAGERQELAAGITERTPDPKAFAEAVLKNGELTISGNTGVLAFSIAGGRGAAYFEREAGVWRVTNGPMVFAAEPDTANETRIEGVDILKHPIGLLALQYLDLIHAGRIEDATKLATADVQAKWKKESNSEKAESLAYLRKSLPTRAAVTDGLTTGTNLRGVLIIEDDTLATLNILVSTQRPAGANTTTYSSSTTGIGFKKEGGQWKLAQ